VANGALRVESQALNRYNTLKEGMLGRRSGW